MTEGGRRRISKLSGRTSTSRFDRDAKTPETEDELHRFVLDAYGIDMPRVAVCPGHVAPMRALWLIYSRSSRAFIVLASRYGGKTHLAALLHLLFARFLPGHESIQLGSIEKQAQRASDLTEKLLMAESGTAARKHPLVAEIRRKITQFLNGSKFEIAAMTPNSVNGPHPHFVAVDELEFLPVENAAAWEESRSMSAGTTEIPALDLVTSTRKWRGSRMDKLLTAQEQAKARGEETAFEVLTWCFAETAANVPNCGKGCGCDKVVSGTWGNGKPRTFADECAGKLKRSAGYVPLGEIHAKFKQVARSYWDAQMSCSKPSLELMVLPDFSAARHCFIGWTPLPEVGPIAFGVDWGSTNPSAALWAQVVTQDEVMFGDRKIEKGTIIVFDEIYRANKSGAEVAELCWSREEFWRERVPGFRVQARVHDVQGKQTSRDFIARYPWQPTWSAQPQKDTPREARLISGLTERDRLLIDTSHVTFLQQEAETWRYPEKRLGRADTPVGEFDHSLSALRFIVGHVSMLQRHGHYGGMTTSDDVVVPMRPEGPVTGASRHRYKPIGESGYTLDSPFSQRGIG
ncbi:MAG: hypothetical protein H0W90_07990 [Actinobacteria bacterium]|nr:hypothetical protein [Actinomycetota bacterium]